MADKVVKLKDGNDFLYPYANLQTVDMNNLLATITITDSHMSDSYTCTQDCYICLNGYVPGCITKNGIVIGANTVLNRLPFPCKKNDVFYFGHNGSGGYTLYFYGVKY